MSTVDLKRDVEGLLTEKVFFQNACIGYGGHLVSIHNYDELYQVACATHRVTPKDPFYWIGLKLYFVRIHQSFT